MKQKNLLFLGLIASIFACAISTSTANAECKILSSEELEDISLEDLKKNYQYLANEYTALLNSTHSDSDNEDYDINQFAPGTPIKEIYEKLGNPTSVEDMDYFKSYNFNYAGSDISCYGLENLLFTFFTDENDIVENYTFSGSCSLDMGTQINNKIVNDLSEKYGDGSISENKFGASQVEWKLPSTCSYSSISISKDSYEKTAITFAFK